MASLHSLRIDNYRGIEHLECTFYERQFTVLIGRCDSGKSTILKAISLVLCPYWNPTISISDFYHEDITKTIEIEVTLSNIPDELLSERKFGLYHRVLVDGKISDDVTSENIQTTLLTVKVVIDGNLEPQWYVTNGRNGEDDVEIKAGDRAKFKTYFIADYVDNHFTFSKGSPLYSLLSKTLIEGEIVNKKLLEIARKANELSNKENHFADIDTPLFQLKDTASLLGLELNDLKALLELKENIYTQSNIALHDDTLPYHLHGKGNKRLLSIAIQLNLINDGGIVLIDELEQGLEPDRVVNLVNVLKSSSHGQVLVTTHSSATVCEAKFHEILVVDKDHKTVRECDKQLQGLLRAAPHTFFAKRIICCEGKTEFGFMRAFDSYLKETFKLSFASKGICIADCGGGSKHLDWALLFASMGYDTIVFSDNDKSDKGISNRFSSLIQQKIPLLIWDKGLCIEQQLLTEIPWSKVLEMWNYCIEQDENLQINVDGEIINSRSVINTFSPDKQLSFRKSFADSAKKNQKDGSKKRNFFKDIDGGEFLGQIWLDSIKELNDTTSLVRVFNEITDWVKQDVKVV